MYIGKLLTFYCIHNNIFQKNSQFIICSIYILLVLEGFYKQVLLKVPITGVVPHPGATLPYSEFKGLKISPNLVLNAMFISKLFIIKVYCHSVILFTIFSTPRGIRIPVTSVKGRCPRPLDDGGCTIVIIWVTIIYYYICEYMSIVCIFFIIYNKY